MRQFEGNEVYGAIESGLTFWWVGTLSDDYRPAAGESVFKDTVVWNAYNKGIFVYPSNRVTIDGFVQRTAFTHGAGIDFGGLLRARLHDAATRHPTAHRRRDTARRTRTTRPS